MVNSHCRSNLHENRPTENSRFSLLTRGPFQHTIALSVSASLWGVGSPRTRGPLFLSLAGVG